MAEKHSNKYSIGSRRARAILSMVTADDNIEDSTGITDLLCRESMPSSPHEIPNSIALHSNVSADAVDFDSDDSVRDKDYEPNLSESGSSDDCGDVPTSKKTKSLKARRQQTARDENTMMDENEPSTSNTIITATDGNEPTTSNTIITARDENIIMDENEPTTSNTVIGSARSVRVRRNTLDIVQDNQCHNSSRKRRHTWDGYLEDIHYTTDNITRTEEVSVERPRKRRKYTTTLAERKRRANINKREQYKVKPGCNNCQKKCVTVFDEASREAVNNYFWKLNWQERRHFIRSHVSIAVPKRKITAEPKRNAKKMFRLKRSDGVSVQVCKNFFLTTLGFKKSNDKVLYNAVNDDIIEGDKRGKHQKTAPFDRNLLTQHVESFHPTEPHYRREHAPLRRYLPSDITITLMHDDFCQKYPNMKVSYELYRSHIKKMNISFTRLGHEECELCEAYELHKEQESHDVLNSSVPDCDVCINWAKHHEKYIKARQLYDEHKLKTQSSSEIFFSADLEKIIMLPRLEAFKAVIFCNRLIAYNQTFAPVGKITAEYKPITAIWHDGIAGRKQEDIMSAFYAFLLRHRDVEAINIWLDNCSAQNKNWLLYSLLLHLINSNLIATKKIILWYFEPGHTFMSCDQVHHQVELAMKKKSKLYDFTDFEEVVGTINNGRVEVKSMAPQSFLNITNHVSERRINISNPRAYL